MDGTLLDANSRLSARTQGVIRRIQDLGIAFTVATGRQYSALRQGLGNLLLQPPVISSDGAWISKHHDPNPIHHYSMSRAQVQEILDKLERERIPFFLDHWDGENTYNLLGERTNPGMSRFLQYRSPEFRTVFHWTRDFSPYLDHELISVNISHNTQTINAMGQWILDTFGGLVKTDVYHFQTLPGWSVMFIQNANARKEVAVHHLRSMLEIAPEDVWVFGDEKNDLGLFQQGYFSVAVENASHELKNLASTIIGPHHRNAVADFLETELLD